MGGPLPGLRLRWTVLCDSSGGNAQWARQDKKRQQKELCTSILRPYQCRHGWKYEYQ
jgi:hypothetical protein